MRTCPACGKENEDSATHCATCDEEIGAGAAVAAETPKGGSSPEGDHETLAVSLSELRAMASKDEAGEKAAEHAEEAEVSAPAAVATSVAAAGENHVPKAAAAVEVSEKPTDEKVEEAPAPAAPAAEKAATPAPVAEEPKAAQATQMVQVEVSSRGPQSFQPGTVKLVVEQGMSVNKEYLLNDPELIIGRRDPEQEFIPDIDLFDQENANNRYISRRQARLYFQEGHLFVEDLDSSNGTCVNNRPIKPNMSVQLNPGDKLLLGQSVMFRIRPMTS